MQACAKHCFKIKINMDLGNQFITSSISPALVWNGLGVHCCVICWTMFIHAVIPRSHRSVQLCAKLPPKNECQMIEFGNIPSMLSLRSCEGSRIDLELFWEALFTQVSLSPVIHIAV